MNYTESMSIRKHKYTKVMITEANVTCIFPQ